MTGFAASNAAARFSQNQALAKTVVHNCLQVVANAGVYVAEVAVANEAAVLRLHGEKPTHEFTVNYRLSQRRAATLQAVNACWQLSRQRFGSDMMAPRT